MYEIWYGYMKPKYNDNVRLCYKVEFFERIKY